MAKPKKSARKGGKRRSRAESMTGKKEGSVEVRTPAIGDNSKLALPDPSDFDHHYKSMRGARDKVKTAQALSSQASESANKCAPGLSKVIKETLKIEDENDPVKLARHLELMGMGLKHINSSIQITIFDTLAGDEEDLVYKRGFEDGKAGRTADNRYPEGSSLHALYAKGWRHGTASNLGISPADADKAFEEEQGTEHKKAA